MPKLGWLVIGFGLGCMWQGMIAGAVVGQERDRVNQAIERIEQEHKQEDGWQRSRAIW
jgi:hypothetical protein